MTSRLARYPHYSDVLKLDSFPNHTENNTWKACGTHAGISGSLQAMWLQESSDILLTQMKASARTRGIGLARALQIIFLGALVWVFMHAVSCTKDERTAKAVCRLRVLTSSPVSRS